MALTPLVSRDAMYVLIRVYVGIGPLFGVFWFHCVHVLYAQRLFIAGLCMIYELINIGG